MFINVEETPNPNTLKFLPEKNLNIDKSFLYKKDDDLEDNIFIKELFNIDGIESVLIDKSFISITKSKKASWDVLRAILTSKIGTFLEKNNYEINLKSNTEIKKSERKILTGIEKEISSLLETRVKPLVASHGGEISFHSFDKGIVYLELKGSCAGCPSSTATLKNGYREYAKTLP